MERFPRSWYLGLTATPARLDGKPLGKYFKKIISGPSMRELIGMGHLSEYDIFAPPGIDMEGVRTRMGDYDREEAAKRANRPSITGDAVKWYRKTSDGKRAIAFCVSIEHSKAVAAEFAERGIPSAHIDGGTPPGERDGLLEDFRTGRIRVLSNVALFIEGLDVPLVEAIIMLRPTQSLTLWLQAVGRGMRPAEGKDRLMVIDHANNCRNLGIPCEDREWSLEKKIKAKKKGEARRRSTRICDKCFAAIPAFYTSCRYCGHQFPVKSRKVEEVDGELAKVDKEAIAKQRKAEQGGARTLEELVALGIKRGYKSPVRWANHILRARRRR